MTDYEKLDWLHFAIQEAINGNTGYLLADALEIVEQLREPYLVTTIKTNWCSFYETRRQT